MNSQDRKDCCDQWDFAKDPGTDNEGYDSLLSFFDGEIGRPAGWYMGSPTMMERIRFCPWCATPVEKGEEASDVLHLRQTYPSADSERDERKGEGNVGTVIDTAKERVSGAGPDPEADENDASPSLHTSTGALGDRHIGIIAQEVDLAKPPDDPE